MKLIEVEMGLCRTIYGNDLNIYFNIYESRKLNAPITNSYIIPLDYVARKIENIKNKALYQGKLLLQIDNDKIITYAAFNKDGKLIE